MKGGGERKERSHHVCISINFNIYERRRFILAYTIGSYSVLFYGSPSGYQTNRAQIQLKDTGRNRFDYKANSKHYQAHTGKEATK